uniref:Nucleoporin Nup37 n=1 Tax=Leptobrachium leishanense TaxID=445787 RepID=A0A8C5PZC8_9ANUR
MKQDSTRKASYSVDCKDFIHVVEFNPFESGEEGTLLAFAGSNSVTVASCKFQEEDSSVNGIAFQTLDVFNLGVRVDAIAWSPETRCNALSPLIRFCAAVSDKSLQVFTSDLMGKEDCEAYEGHTSNINDVVFCSSDGSTFASVSDDHTCRVWMLDKGEMAKFILQSPGMSVAWHPEEASKLMVAEKKGAIRFYDLMTQQAVLSLESTQSPLMSADWSLKNTLRVGAVAGNDWIIWEMPHSSYPQSHKPAHPDKARVFRWSKFSENVFATTGYPGKMNTQLQIHHLKHPQPILIGSVPVGNGLSWHRTLPVCVVGGNCKLFFWFTEI